MPDRRLKARFEVVGRLPATLATERRARLHNVSRSGALIESGAMLPRDSIITLTLESDRKMATLRARVCHIRHNPIAEGYLVGLEFVNVEPAELAWLTEDDASDHAHGA